MVQLYSSALGCPAFLPPFFEKTVLSLLSAHGSLVKNHLTTYVKGFTSGLSIIFHWSVHLSLCQCHTVVIIIVML